MSLDVQVAHAFGAFRLDVAFEAPPGVTALFGRSGSGKTTVVNAIAGLFRPQAGRIVVDGTTLLDTARRLETPRHRRRVGYVFQEGRLFPHLTVRQNLRFGAWLAPRAARSDPTRRADAASHFARVVDLLGVGPLLDRRPDALSGGEKQRVAIGRALLSRPNVLLMDEPLASLDDARKESILPYLERLRDETRIPIVYVSHAAAEVTRLATTVVALADGRVAAVGPPEEVLATTEPASILMARVVATEADGVAVLACDGGTLLLRLRATVGDMVRLRVRERDVLLSREAPQGLGAPNALPGVVEQVGGKDRAFVEVEVRCGSSLLRARVMRRTATALGLEPGALCHAIVLDAEAWRPEAESDHRRAGFPSGSARAASSPLVLGCRPKRAGATRLPATDPVPHPPRPTPDQ